MGLNFTILSLNSKVGALQSVREGVECEEDWLLKSCKTLRIPGYPWNLFRICEKSFHQSFLNHHDTDPGRRLARDQDLIFFIKISVNAEARILFFLS